MEGKVRGAVRNQNLIQAGDRVLLAFSGGRLTYPLVLCPFHSRMGPYMGVGVYTYVCGWRLASVATCMLAWPWVWLRALVQCEGYLLN